MVVVTSFCFEVGLYNVCFLDMGDIWLDGGAMFGVVFKFLWSKSFMLDDWNRI